jgi:hypothetical protein
MVSFESRSRRTCLRLISISTLQFAASAFHEVNIEDAPEKARLALDSVV